MEETIIKIGDLVESLEELKNSGEIDFISLDDILYELENLKSNLNSIEE